MIKPILAIGIPKATKSKIIEIEENISNKIKDYHIIVYPLYNQENIKIEVFCKKDIIDIELKDLKELILKNMNVKNTKENVKIKRN